MFTRKITVRSARASIILIYVLLLPTNIISIFGQKTQLDQLKDKIATKVIDTFFQDALPLFLGQSGNNENGTDSLFKDYLLRDESNDNLSESTPQQIISRSGFNYENYNVLADDGYVTQLIRIVNPLADPEQLKQPPVMLMHGAITDPTIFVGASAIQHNPEKWPRDVENDGPISSWNRSMAFMLANNGYDVWLISTRGCNSQNMGHNSLNAVGSVIGGKNIDKNMTFGESLLQLFHSTSYWQFSMDDIIEHELPRQMDKVLEVSGAEKVALVTYSFSTMISLGLLGSKENHANKVHSYVAIAPIINNNGTNKLLRALHEVLCPLVPEEVGNMLLSDFLLSSPIRGASIAITRSKRIRYSLYKAFTTSLFGPSPKYQTNLEPTGIGHLFMPTSFREVKHYCQQVVAGRLQKFHYGEIQNQLIYGSQVPPVYDLSDIRVKNWAVVSGTNDKFATIDSVAQILQQVRPKASQHILIPGYNHLDLLYGVENDKYVNLPVLNFLDQVQLARSSRKHSLSQEDGLDQFVLAVPPNDSNLFDSFKQESENDEVKLE